MGEHDKKFLARYYHDGAWWNLELFANDFEDAQVICDAHNLQLDGEQVMTIPVTTGEWLPNLIIRLGNFLQRKRANQP